MRHGRPILVAGGAGGPTTIMGTVAAISSVVDFGDDVAHAIDRPRIDARGFGPVLSLEDTRLDPTVIEELGRRGHTIQRQGEYAAKPIINVAGTNLAARTREAATDPRGDPAEWGATGQ